MPCDFRPVEPPPGVDNLGLSCCLLGLQEGQAGVGAVEVLHLRQQVLRHHKRALASALVSRAEA